MTADQYRLARLRPRINGAAAAGTAYFATNTAADFDSAAGKLWTLVPSPFTGSPGNQGSAWDGAFRAGVQVLQDDVDFLAPCAPANVFGMAHNTGAPGRALPPQAFHKAATSVVGPGETILLAAGTGAVEPEAELAAVVGVRSRHLNLANARSALLGYTIGNDVTARGLQLSDQLWISAKSQDTYTPLGPWIVAGGAPGAFDDAAIGITHNGERLRTASTADLGWNVAEILVYLSSFMTLHPGDVVLTGFPAQSRPLQPGDTVSCAIAGIGALSNPVGADA
ncbi:MAG: fumarylacetoacetate hydrolase family protein [Actinomycetales bacterium]